MDVDAVFLFANAVATLACGGTIVYLLYATKLKKHFLFYFWALAFFLYGAEITLRALSTIGAIPFYTEAIGVLLYSAFLLFPIGLWSLSHRREIVYILIPVYIIDAIFYGLVISGLLPQQDAFVSIQFFFYLPIIVTLLDHRYIFGKSLDKIAIGWLLLFIINLIMPDSSWILDTLNIFAKAVILWGITEYDFVILVKNIRERMIQRASFSTTEFKKEGVFEIVKYSSSKGSQENVEWIKRKIGENISQDVKSYVFCFQDTIQHHMLRSLKAMGPEKVSILLFSSNSAHKDNDFVVLPMGLTEVGAALSEITQSNLNSQNGCTVFLSNFSLLIHTFGAYPCYNMILSKIGEIRRANVEVIAFVSPETHKDKSVIPLFTNISDKTTET
jgi:NADH:ubiquinone oxidoreductase subunit K